MLAAVQGIKRTRSAGSRTLPWVGRTFRTQVFFGFLLTSLITATLGISGWLGIADAARSVAQSFERATPPTADARTAQLAFSRLETARLRTLLPGFKRSADAEETHDRLVATLSAALATLSQRALSEGTAAAARRAQGSIERWTTAAAMAPSAGEPDLADQLDRLVGLTQQDAAREKAAAATALSDDQMLRWAEVFGAIFLSLLLTSIMVRRITQPLSDAVALAVRITNGDLSVPIPQTVQGEAGTLLRSMRVMQDSIRRMMEQEKLQRRSAQTRLVDALEGADEAVALVDAERRIVLANSQVTAFFPSAAGQLGEGSSFLDLLSCVDRGRAENRGRTVTGAGNDRPAAPPEDPLQQFLQLPVEEMQLADGRWLRVSRNPTRDGGFFVLWSDVTAMKDREAKLRTAKLEAEVANAAKNRFLATVGHELRTPLNAIIGFSEIMEAETLGPLGCPSYNDFASHILNGGRQLLESINSMLDLARSDAGTLSISPDVVDLRRLLADCAKGVRERCRLAGLDFGLELPAELQVWGDPIRLRQTFLNLLSNAVKFTPAGGCVGLSAEDQGDGWIEVRIVDTGIGMRPQDIPLAIAPFHQIDNELNRSFEGTGLGLPLAKTLVDLHGGNLLLESEKDVGTVVKVRLRADTPAAVTAAGSSAA